MGIEGGLGTRKHLGVKVRTWAGSPGAFWSHRVLGDSRARDPPSSNSTGLCVKQVVGAEYSSHGVIVQVLDRGGRAHKGCGKSGNSEGEGLWQGPGTLRQGKLTRLAGGTWAWPRRGVAQKVVHGRGLDGAWPGREGRLSLTPQWESSECGGPWDFQRGPGSLG